MAHAFHPVRPNVNFPEMEKRILTEWYERGIVDKYLHRNDAAKKRFSFLDGPITANNPMGVHHAWGRTYKDLWQRFYAMRGYKERFQNGFDCQGLWVEVEVEKELGIKNKKDIENLVPGDSKASIAKFIELCKARVLKYSSIQTEQSKRLGYFMDWDHSYFTMSDENNYMIWHFLKTCFEKGWMYKGRDSVPWCPRCQTAISQHEMLTEDYKEVSHKAIYFTLPIVGRDNEYLLVWTTTPWTIPANIAVAVDENLDYVLVETNDGKQLWLAKDRLEAVMGKQYQRIIKTVKGKELVGLFYKGAFDTLPAVAQTAKSNRKTFHKVIPTDPLILPITATEGTGLVHTAVSAGSEDFKLGKKYGLPMIAVIADDASYLPNLGFLSGQNAKKHPEIILDYLTERETHGEHWVFKIEQYTHRYPACWRCKTELVWKVAEEWYIAMDRPSHKASDGKQTLRRQMVEVAKKIDWHPRFGLERELDWLTNMHDWLISKPNRYWGLAIPIYECQKCGWFTVIGSYEELKERAVSGWKEFEGHSPHKPFIDEVKIKCEKCGEVVSRLDDVGNVWLDAGIVPFSTYIDPETKQLSYTTDKKYWKQWFPADFITESFPGQFKNWFYSMIAMATVLENKHPYKTVLGFASMLGEDGRPMHKSWGNAIEFGEGADKIGVDVMRWMFATHDPEQNLLFGYKKADETRRKFHLLLWNVYNFFVTYANVDGITNYDLRSTNVLDEWIVSKLKGLVSAVTLSLEKYDAMTAANSIEIFVTDLSQWYVRRSRDRVGPTVENSLDKESCYATLYEVLITLCKLLAPFTPFLAEEIYQNLTGEASVHLSDWPMVGIIDTKLHKQMEMVRKICELGHAIRKEHKIKVRQPLKELRIKNYELRIKKDFLQLITDELNVKNIIIEKGKGKLEVAFDLTLTPELKNEGDARELVRQIQILRKEKGCRIDERVKVQLPKEYQRLKDHFDYIRKETLAGSIVWGESLNVSTG
ncbi:isoleucine--tRNA ligase [Candidatus Gottesmanbacteria bacterium]|nr:isoleucine--tRNA ligase [Candidatus Gottesmanbacteria bacterium]